MSVVEFSTVSKSYLIVDSHSRRLGTLLAPWFFSGPRFRALQNLTFSLRRGETLCVIGRNGAGKSTLLQLVAGICQPTSGTVRVSGAVSTLLELGTGFHPDFSGRENVHLSASILGFSAEEARLLYPHIAEFAGIGDFIDRPVRTYSSGMLMRLAFALAINVEPEILIVDEALSVGDEAFRHRCLRKVKELRARGVSILFVSHSMADVKAIGDRALWLDRGGQRELGPAERVADSYLAEFANQSPISREPQAYAADSCLEEVSIAESRSGSKDDFPNFDGRRGDGRARIGGFSLLDRLGRPATRLLPGQEYTAKFHFLALSHLRRPRAAVLIRNHLGLAFTGIATSIPRDCVPPLKPGDRCLVEIRFNLPEFYPGFFSFSPSVFEAPDPAAPDQVPCDWIDNALTLQMERASGEVYGAVHVEARIRWSRPLVQREPASA